MTIDATKIELLMAEQGLSQIELGKRCEISRQSISSIIRRGRAEPKTIGKLANGLGVTVMEIILQNESQVQKTFETEVASLANKVKVEGAFNKQVFFETVAAILSRKYGIKISLKATEGSEDESVVFVAKQQPDTQQDSA